jgi:hypothetical protein
MRFAPIAVVFLLFALRSSTAVAIVAVILFALCAVGDVTSHLPPPRRIAYGCGVVLAGAAAFAVPMRGIADVTPELQQLLAIEQNTSGVYEAASRKFKRGAITAASLAKLIDEAIVPELQAADERISRITGIPRNDVGRVQDAREYIRLRTESWNLRATGLGAVTEELPASTSVCVRERRRIPQPGGNAIPVRDADVRPRRER